jgi:hypothetical protein
VSVTVTPDRTPCGPVTVPLIVMPAVAAATALPVASSDGGVVLQPARASIEGDAHVAIHRLRTRIQTPCPCLIVVTSRQKEGVALP